MIRLPNHEPEGKTQDPVEKMLAALYTIFKAEKTPEEKCKDLKNRYGIGISTEFENEVRTMCNFSEAILERGIEQGIEQGRTAEKEQAIVNMLDLGLSKERIAEKYPIELIEKVMQEIRKG